MLSPCLYFAEHKPHIQSTRELCTSIQLPGCSLTTLKQGAFISYTAHCLLGSLDRAGALTTRPTYSTLVEKSYTTLVEKSYTLVREP